MIQAQRDEMILEFIRSGRIVVDAARGLVYSTRSNTPQVPVGSPTKKGYLRAGFWTAKRWISSSEGGGTGARARSSAAICSNIESP